MPSDICGAKQVAPSVINGFILTAQVVESGNQSYIELWLASECGPVRAYTCAQPWVFFALQSQKQRIDVILQRHHISYSSKPLTLSTFQHQSVSGLYFKRGKDFYQARKLLKANDITCFEDDIRMTERYLMERFVYASCEVLGQPPAASDVHLLPQAAIALNQVQLKPSKFVPTLKVLSLDIECSEQGELFSIGLAESESQKSVFMIGTVQQQTSAQTLEWITWVTDEQALLSAFVEQIRIYDPDVIIGWNVVNFDFRLLVERAKLCKVVLGIGRNGDAPMWRNAANSSNNGYVSISGRVVVDGIDALKTATYQFDSFSLEHVAQSLLGKGKSTDNVDNRLAQIEHDFVHNKVKLARYNIQDCQLVLDIFAHTKVLDFLVLRSQLTGLELDRMGGSVAAFINLYLPKLHRAGYIAPNRPEDGGLASPGGYVMESLPGLYTNVLVLDFKSLYPSIIRTFKIDPLGLVEGLKEPTSAIQGYKGALFHRDKHFLPDIITSLWRQRDRAKQTKDNARSQAIKILMNSFYGVLGSGGCPFYDTRLASSITMRGHDIMQTTANWIEQAGYKVIYGDTDSTFVWLDGDYDTEQVNQIGEQLAAQINQSWKATIEQQHQLASELEIEFETHFSQFLMPTIRGSELGSKKRYAGTKVTDNGSELVFKGLESVRSDWTALAKDFQYKLYEMVFAKQQVDDYVKKIIAQTYQGKLDASLVYRKRIRRQLSLYVKNIPPHVRAARMADKMNQKLGKPLRYQNKGWISYVITVNGPEPLEYAKSQIDYQHYIDKQIRPIADGILPFVGLSFEGLASRQLGLF